jgi:hypothetical protein
MVSTNTVIQEVQFSYGSLEAIKEKVTRLASEGVPDADLIYMVWPEPQHDRVVVTVRASSTELFRALDEMFGVDAIAVQVVPIESAPRAGSRAVDSAPYWGGARIHGVYLNVDCSDGFSWRIGTAYAMLTAAHCVSSGGGVTVNSTAIGTVSATSEENWDALHGTQYYTGQSIFRGDVGLIRLSGSYTAGPYIYRGGPTSSSSSPVISTYLRYMASGDVVYVGGANTGETGPYTVDMTGIDVLYDPPSDKWVRNVSSAARGTLATCAGDGDSGGSVFSLVSGGVRAAGVFSGFLACRIFFTDYYNAYLGLPGAAFLY